MVVKEAERRRSHHSTSPSMSASPSSGSPDADHDHHKRRQRRRRRPSGSDVVDDLNETPSSSSKQIRVRSRDRGRHRERERGRDLDHRHRSSTLPDLGTASMTAADDDGNGDKPWFKKKTLWASVATMVSKCLFCMYLWLFLVGLWRHEDTGDQDRRLFCGDRCCHLFLLQAVRIPTNKRSRPQFSPSSRPRFPPTRARRLLQRA